MSLESSSRNERLLEFAGLFLKLGATVEINSTKTVNQISKLPHRSRVSGAMPLYDI
jgi:hypothetical protein